MEAARNLKANLKLDGQTCLACKTALKLGDDASVCTACDGPHHARCWNSYGGCATKGCANAPLRRLDAPAYAPSPPAASPYGASPYAAAPYPPAPLPYGYVHCRSCRQVIGLLDPMCPYCRAITSPDGMYRGPRYNAPGAVASLVLGIVGILFCGIVLGPIGIAQASKAKRDIATNPMYEGGGLATAGLVLSIVATVAWAFIALGAIAGNNN